MRTLSEIIDDCRDGKKPDLDELRYAVCVMDCLMSLDWNTISRIKNENVRIENIFDRKKRALSVSPKEWLGPNNDPDDEQVQKRREASKKLFKRITQ